MLGSCVRDRKHHKSPTGVHGEQEVARVSVCQVMVAGLRLPEEPSPGAEPVYSERMRMSHGAWWEQQAQRKCLMHIISALPASEHLCLTVTSHEVGMEWAQLLQATKGTWRQPKVKGVSRPAFSTLEMSMQRWKAQRFCSQTDLSSFAVRLWASCSSSLSLSAVTCVRTMTPHPPCRAS